MAIEDRTKILLGLNYEKMGKIKVSIAGIGGVGSIIPLILARTGVKKIVLVDKDVVDSSNLNRQIAYDFQDINTRKIDAISQKIEKISPNVEISAHFSRIDDTFDFEIFKDSDFIVDAIDDLHAKVLLIKYALTNNIKIISSLGMGNRIDSTKVEITKLNKTTDDPLARKLRYLLKKEGLDISKFDVCYSKEKPIVKDKVIASIGTVPNAAGLAIVSEIIKKVCME